MSVKSRRSVGEKLNQIRNSTYANLFQGIMTFERIGLLEFEALNNLTDTTTIIPYNVLLLYLPMIFSEVINSDKLRRLLAEDGSLIIADFVEGAVYRRKLKDKLHLDLYRMAIDDKKNSGDDKRDSLDSKMSQVLTGDLDKLYEKNRMDINNYLKEAESLNDTPDPLVTHEEPTITSVIRSKMDKSTDSINGLA